MHSQSGLFFIIFQFLEWNFEFFDRKSVWSSFGYNDDMNRIILLVTHLLDPCAVICFIPSTYGMEF